MQPSQLALHRRLDELVLEALVPHQQVPVARPSELEVSIETVRDDDAADEVAVTSRFVRFSAPYERVEIAPLPGSLAALRGAGGAKPTTFARTVPGPASQARATLAFDSMWFDQPEAVLAAIEDPPTEPATSWRWLFVSLVVAAAAVTSLAIHTAG